MLHRLSAHAMFFDGVINEGLRVAEEGHSMIAEVLNHLPSQLIPEFGDDLSFETAPPEHDVGQLVTQNIAVAVPPRLHHDLSAMQAFRIAAVHSAEADADLQQSSYFQRVRLVVDARLKMLDEAKEISGKVGGVIGHDVNHRRLVTQYSNQSSSVCGPLAGPPKLRGAAMMR